MVKQNGLHYKITRNQTFAKEQRSFFLNGGDVIIKRRVITKPYGGTQSRLILAPQERYEKKAPSSKERWESGKVEWVWCEKQGGGKQGKKTDGREIRGG